ncbi:MAG: ABC transporter permease [Schleiferiaceae bacterium]|nr:ABC transporter permease [Schleiferiaceae bacterium]
MIWSSNIQTFTRHPGAWFVLGIILCAIFAPLLVLDSSDMANDMDLRRAMLAPGSSSEMGTHWFGTDKFGRDHFSRIILGSRISLTVGLIAVSISLVIGIPVGAAAGYFGGRVDQFLSWLMSVLWSIPTLLLVIALTFVLGKGLTQVFIAVGLTMWVEVARVVRGQFLAEKQKEYVEAANVLGFGTAHIMFKEILPNTWGPLLVICTTNFASALLIESGLSFLGIGAQPPMPSWGSMIRDYYPYLMTGKAYLSLIPGALIAASVLSLNSLSAALSTDQ